MKQILQIIFFLMILVFVGFCGAWISQSNLSNHSNSNDMHAFFHDELDITEEQETQLSDIEKEFKRLKTLYEGQMKTANLELAQAIKEGGYNSPEIENIVKQIHKAMGSLQALSLEHLASMEKVLTVEQNKELEDRVIEQLQRNAE